jgi:hypothetical protein
MATWSRRADILVRQLSAGPSSGGSLRSPDALEIYQFRCTMGDILDRKSRLIDGIAATDNLVISFDAADIFQ